MPEVNFLVKKGLTVPKGSAATPAVIFDASDPNTGIYSPGADQLALSTNGTGRLFVDASGNVLVGTNSSVVAGYNFQVNGSCGVASTANAAIEFGIRTPDATFNDSYLSFGTPTQNRAQIYCTGGAANTGSLVFNTYNAGAGAERLRITSAGLVGIGSSVPGTLLHLAGNNTGTTGDSPVATIRLEDTDGSTSDDQPIGKIEFYGNDGTTPAVGVQSYIISRAVSTSGGGYLEFGTRPNGGASADPRMRIDGSGRVGIGTTSPSSSALLDVTSTTAGFLPPRMTTAQRDAISSPAAGLMVYNTSTNKLNFYNGTAWEAVTST